MMTGFFKWMAMSSVVGLLAASSAVAQQSLISEKEFYAYLRASHAATGDVPYRTRSTVEFGQKETGPWRPMGSSVKEAVPPDRYRTTYSSGTPSESIHIANNFYSKQPDGTWNLEVSEHRAIVPGPAVLHGFDPPATFTELRGDGNSITVTAISKPKGEAGNHPKKSRIYVYRIDYSGVLVEKTSTGYNGTTSRPV